MAKLKSLKVSTPTNHTPEKSSKASSRLSRTSLVSVNEVYAIRDKIVKKVSENPAKTATLLSDWINRKKKK